jgi:hypothetical protein
MVVVTIDQHLPRFGLEAPGINLGLARLLRQTRGGREPAVGRRSLLKINIERGRNKRANHR